MKTPENMLLVEDISYELEAYVCLAKQAGFAVWGVRPKADALALLEQRPFDILISDVFLSETVQAEGLDLLREAIFLHPKLLTIVMSSHPSVDRFLEAMELGALFALKKPLISADEITIAVRMAKERRALKQAQPLPPLR